MLASSKKKQYYQAAFEQTLSTYSQQLLSPDVDTANVYAKMAAQQKQLGSIRPIFDLWIAATAKTSNLSLVTRNTKDFIALDLKLINPFLP